MSQKLNQQLSICEEFDHLLKEKLDKTIESIEQETYLCKLSTNKLISVDYFSTIADELKILDVKQLLNQGFVLFEQMNKRVRDKIEHTCRRSEVIECKFEYLVLNIIGLVPEFQTFTIKTEAELIETTMKMQLSLLEKFIHFIQSTLDINTRLIRQQTRLYELTMINERNVDYFINKADGMNVLSVKQLIELSLQKLKELNVKNAEQMKYLMFKLENVMIDNR